MSTTMTPILQTALPSTNADISGSFTAAGLTIRLSCALKAPGEDTLTLLKRNDSGYWEITPYVLHVKRGADFTNASASLEIPVNAADSYHVMSTTGFATSSGNASVKLNSLQPPSGLASVPSHGSTHLSNGSDPIPLAVSGGASGLMSGTQAAQLEQLTGTAPGGTQTLTTSVADSGASQVAYISDNSVALTAGRLWSERNAGVEKFAIRFDGGAIAPTIGPAYTQQHTLPAVASDTIVLLAATQELAAKTLTAAVIKTGLTASGSASNDFSASTGTFKTSTGAVTIGGGAAAIGITSSGAAITITGGAASTWKTTSGALTVDGNGGVNLQKADATLVDVGVTSATAVTLAANINFSGAAGTGALSLGSMTGATALPTGNLSWTGASTKTVSIVSTGAASTITITAGATSTWGTSAGGLVLDAFTGTTVKINGTAVLDIGVTAAGALTLAANKSIVGAAGTGSVTFGAMTGDMTAPTGAHSWAGASGKAASFVATAAAITITGGAASTWSTSAGALTVSGFAGINLQVNGSTVCDVGATSANVLTFAANKSLSCASGTTSVDLSAGTGQFKPTTGTFTFQGKQAATATANTIADPGNAGAIPVTTNGVCPLTSAGAETRTLAIPTFMGQTLYLICDTYVGDIVVTSAQPINQANNTTMTFGVVNDNICLVAMTIGGALRWRVQGNNGVALG